jgi:hypothetical protein
MKMTISIDEESRKERLKIGYDMSLIELLLNGAGTKYTLI